LAAGARGRFAGREPIIDGFILDVVQNRGKTRFFGLGLFGFPFIGNVVLRVCRCRFH
jgi:hypothetical protein